MGTPESFAAWYEERYRRMLAAVTVTIGAIDDAREATDEAFSRALLHWDRVQAMASPEGWTYRVAVNVHRTRLRRRAVEERVLRRLVLPDVEWPAGSEIWSQVALLPARQRAVVAMRFLADMPEGEIAATLGIARGTVASSLHRALQALRRTELAEDLHG